MERKSRDGEKKGRQWERGWRREKGVTEKNIPEAENEGDQRTRKERSLIRKVLCMDYRYSYCVANVRASILPNVHVPHMH